MFSYSCILRSSKSHASKRHSQDSLCARTGYASGPHCRSRALTVSWHHWISDDKLLSGQVFNDHKNNVTCCFPPILDYLSLHYFNRVAPHFLCSLILAVSMATFYPPVVTAGTFTVCSDLVAVLLFPEHRPSDK